MNAVRRSVLSCALLALASMTGTVAAQQPCPTSGAWLEIGGRRLVRMGPGVRVPPGQPFAVVAAPLGAAPPAVRIRSGAESEWRQLPVEPTGDGCGWRAAVEGLPPLSRLDLQVTRTSPLGEAQRADVRRTLVAMLGATATLWSQRVVPPDGTQAEQQAVLREQLAAQFPPASTLAQLRLRGAARAEQGLGAQLIELAVVDLRMADSLNRYASHLQAMGEALTSDSVGALPQAYQDAIRRLREALPPELLGYRGGTFQSVAPLFLAEPPLLPLSATAQAALRDLVRRARTPVEQNRDTTRIRYLGTSLEDLLPDLFARLAAVSSVTYAIGTVGATVSVGDLSRLGTVDFVAGQVLRGERRNLGFLTLSFFPGGPQPRTPEADLVDGGRLALTVGYSVAGKDSISGDYLLAGVTLRLTRLVSVTVGAVSPERGGSFRCCFVGAAGDLTNLPFLGDLFTRGTDGNR